MPPAARAAARDALRARPREVRQRELDKWRAERKADAWLAARRVLVRLDPSGEADEETLRAAASPEDWAVLEAAVPLEPEEVILILPGYDPRAQAGDCWFDREAALRAVAFFRECLRLTEGEWADRPFDPEPWQQAILMNLFGWRRPDGMRRYREVFLEVPRKNGKTPFAAGLALLLLVADKEPGAQIYAAAADRGQAAILWRHAALMVEKEPVLAAVVRPYRAGKSLEYAPTGSFFRALSREARTKHGFNVHAAIVDELHAQKDGRLVEALSSASGTRRQSVHVYITTRDYDRESVCNEKERYALAVRDGRIEDPEFLPVIYALEEGEDWEDPAVHRRVNPGWGICIKPDEFARELRKAKYSPTERNSFLRLRLNARTQSSVAWIPLDRWDLGAVPPMEDGVGGRERWIEQLGLEALECWGGLDLSRSKDLSAFVLYFPAVHAVLPWLWAPRAGAEERERDEGPSYLGWAQEGWIELTPGDVIDYDVIQARILEAAERFRIRSVAFDRFMATQLTLRLKDEGLDMVKMGQGFASMNAPARELERLFLQGKLLHGGHPVLRYCAGATAVKEDAGGNIKPDKAGSKSRIDPIVALCMAVGEAIVADPAGGDAYADRGFVTL